MNKEDIERIIIRDIKKYNYKISESEILKYEIELEYKINLFIDEINKYISGYISDTIINEELKLIKIDFSDNQKKYIYVKIINILADKLIDYKNRIIINENENDINEYNNTFIVYTYLISIYNNTQNSHKDG